MTHPATYSPERRSGAAVPAPETDRSAPAGRAAAPAAPAKVHNHAMDTAHTHAHPSSSGAATAGATPDAAEATPAATPAAPGAPEGAPAASRKAAKGWPRQAAGTPATAGAASTVAPATGQASQATKKAGGQAEEAAWVGRALLAVAITALPLVGLIGFAISYDTLEGFAQASGFGKLSPLLPIGIDVSIIGLLALDLVMIRAGRPKRSLVPCAHLMTAVTVILNTGSALPKGLSVWEGLAARPLQSLMHAAMPILFVFGVGALRHWLKGATEGVRVDRIPFHRWVLAPVTTARLYRRMRLAGVASYRDMIKREQDLLGYTVMLKKELGGSLKGAKEEQLLPIKMAPRGFTVEEALALPEEWERQKEAREEAKAERQAAEAERRRAEADRKRAEAEHEAKEASRARIAEINRAADERSAEHLAQARTQESAGQAEAARVQAEQAARQAERRARQTEQAEQSAEEAEANRRKAEADRIAEEERVKAEKARAEADRLKAETDRREAERAYAASQRIAQANRDAQTEQETARHKLEAAKLREAAARAEAAAEAAEDFARLTPRQRNIRRVARMLLAAHPANTPADKINPEAVPLAEIGDRLKVSRTVSGEIRQEAVQLLATGYQGQDAHLDVEAYAH